jgi:NADH dehydrogenase
MGIQSRTSQVQDCSISFTAARTSASRGIGGFRGLATVHGLRDMDVDVTLIDRQPYNNSFSHCCIKCQPPQQNADGITWFPRSMRTASAQCLLPQRQRPRSRPLRPPDHRSGRRGELLRHSRGRGVDSASPAGKTLGIRDRILAKLEEAVMNEQQRHLRILVVAGGATGVETADALAEAAEQRHADDLTKLPLARTCHP